VEAGIINIAAGFDRRNRKRNCATSFRMLFLQQV